MEGTRLSPRPRVYARIRANAYRAVSARPEDTP